jgi:predicted nucleic acid-binding protein
MKEEKKIVQETAYFLDTYAMIEIAKGNKKFEKFLDNELFTSLFNLYEFYFILLKDFSEPLAKEFFYQFKRRVIQIRDEHIFNAALFRKQNSKKGFSYVDCLGYSMAVDLGIKFLTGDSAFENVDNVDFVKKQSL